MKQPSGYAPSHSIKPDMKLVQAIADTVVLSWGKFGPAVVDRWIHSEQHFHDDLAENVRCSRDNGRQVVLAHKSSIDRVYNELKEYDTASPFSHPLHLLENRNNPHSPEQPAHRQHRTSLRSRSPPPGRREGGSVTFKLKPPKNSESTPISERQAQIDRANHLPNLTRKLYDLNECKRTPGYKDNFLPLDRSALTSLGAVPDGDMSHLALTSESEESSTARTLFHREKSPTAPKPAAVSPSPKKGLLI